jgi:hypothetical protein
MFDFMPVKAVASATAFSFPKWIKGGCVCIRFLFFVTSDTSLYAELHSAGTLCITFRINAFVR